MSFTEPIVSDIPALVLTDAIDPRTPPPDTRETAARLGNATVIEYPGVGHGVVSPSDCTVSIAVSFLADPTGDVAITCLEGEPVPFG